MSKDRDESGEEKWLAWLPNFYGRAILYYY
jgi:hypothetical protein